MANEEFKFQIEWKESTSYNNIQELVGCISETTIYIYFNKLQGQLTYYKILRFHLKIKYNDTKKTDVDKHNIQQNE